MKPSTGNHAHGRQIAPCVAALAGLVLFSLLLGCQSWTNPVANGVPVRMLPPELLAESKDSLEAIPLSYLRRRPSTHKVGPDDVLGIYVEGVLGSEDELPPVNFNVEASLPPSVGYPIAVRDDGTLPLPFIEPLPVSGMTLSEVEARIKRAYTKDKQVIEPDLARILVTLIKPRTVRILVIREDSATGVGSVGVRRSGFGGTEVIQGGGRGTGKIVVLPADEADVLSALAETGGLPGKDAENEVVIQRGYSGDASTVPSNMQLELPAGGLDTSGRRQVVRIPLRAPRGNPPRIPPRDIELVDGDIVYVASRDAEVYYTGGILGTIEVPLPRDYDIGVVEAIARVGGSLVNGGFNGSNLAGGLVSGGVGAPNPSLLTVLRRSPDGRQVAIRVDLNEALREPRENILVQAKDVLILQETPGEALARYARDVFNLSFVGTLFRRADGTGIIRAGFPQGVGVIGGQGGNL